MTIYLLFGTFFLFFILKVPIAIAMGIAALVVTIFSPELSITFLAHSMVTSTDSFALMAIPFFILSGDIMGKGGISKRLFNFINIFVGRFYGGTAIAAVITCMFFAAISGSGPATVAAVGGMVIPIMLEEGYNKNFTTVLLATAGALGIIIPPSIPLVLYGVASNTSIGELFLGGLVPGITMGLTICLFAYVYSRKNGHKGSDVKFSAKQIFDSLKDAIWAILVPVIILGGIYGGVFTPTEAAVIAVVYSLIVAMFIYKELKIKDLPEIFIGSAGSAATILLVIGTASAFGTIMSIESIPQRLATALLSLSTNPVVIMVLILILLLIVGMFMDTSAAVIIFTPILYPIATSIGIDPIHFGVILIATLAIGFITPPVGVNLFVAMNIAKTKMVEIFPYIMPLIGVTLLALIIIIVFPQLTFLLI